MKSKLSKLIQAVRSQMRRYAFILVVFLVVLLLPLQACAAIQTGLPVAQRAAEITAPILSRAEVVAGVAQDETFVMSKPGIGYVVSWLTENGRVFMLVINKQILPRVLLCGLDRSCGMETQFVNDGFKPIFEQAVVQSIIAKILSMPMPSLMLFPVLPNMDLNNFMHQGEIQS